MGGSRDRTLCVDEGGSVFDGLGRGNRRFILGGLGRLGTFTALGALAAFARLDEFSVLVEVLLPSLLAFGRTADVVALGVEGMFTEVFPILGRDLATFGRLLDRQADAPPRQIEIDDLDPELFTRSDDLLGGLDVMCRHLGDVHQAFDAVADLYERPERHQLCHSAIDKFADAVVGREFLPRILLGGLQREADALAVEVDLEHLDRDLVADLHDLVRMIDVLPRQLGHVDESIHATEIDESTEVDDRRYDALANFAGTEVVEKLLALV